MGLFDRFRKERRAEGEVQFEDALLNALLGTAAVSRETALQVPTISGGIDLIANVIAGTPIKLYRDDGRKAVELRDDYRIPLLNDESGDTLNANEFWHAMIRDYYLGKGGYAYICKSRGKIRSIHYVEEQRVSVIKNADPIFKEYDLQVNGACYKPWDFLKILRNTRDGAQGVPITVENSRMIAVAYQKMVLEYAMAKRGGNKKGFLKAEHRLDEASMTALKSAWQNLYANSDSEAMMVLNKGVDFVEVSDTSAEMQLDENKKTNAQEFAKLFHVSPEAIAGKETDMEAIARLAAIPLMQTIQCALNRDLLLEKEKQTLYFAFDTKEMLKGDMRQRADFYKSMIDANVMQIDEARYMEDLPALGLDFIKLGLQDVLYDPATKTVYTPNTNQTETLDKNSLSALREGDKIETQEELPIEPRGDYIQDPSTGRMNGSHPGGGSKDAGGSGAEKDIRKQSEKSLKKGIASLEKKIEEHEGYLKDPKSHVKDWDSYPQQRKDRDIRHWKKEISDFNVSIQNRVNELERRKKE